jgi:hypothetical protein
MSCCPQTAPASELTVENAAEHVERFVQEELPGCVYPTDRFDGRGIVIAAGGIKFQINAWVAIRMLRMLGCELPIECWYLGARERNAVWEQLVRDYDVQCVNAHEVRKQHPHAKLHGWELKPYAIQHSSFQEVLFLDADNVVVRDPTFLFETSQFDECGTIFWPDFGRLGRDRLAWKVFGDIPYRDEPEVESGQIVLDKARCWPALELCHWYMQNSNNFFFRHVHGDKEVFHLAWRRLGLEYAMPKRGIDALPGVMCQHDFEGNRVFQHRNMRKWSFHHNPRTPRFQYEDECLRFIDELKAQWSPAAQTLASDDDVAAMVELDGRSYEYRRVGHDRRPLTFRSDGTFTAGDAGRERYWTIREGRLLICGDDGLLTMGLEPRPDGSWEGRWLVYEKMPIILEPTS